MKSKGFFSLVPQTPDGVPLHKEMCTCATHCKNTCEASHCGPNSGYCNCWCHKEEYEAKIRASNSVH